jgi:hypothetical protein
MKMEMQNKTKTNSRWLIWLLCLTNVITLCTLYAYYWRSLNLSSCNNGSPYALQYSVAQTLVHNYLNRQLNYISPDDGSIQGGVMNTTGALNTNFNICNENTTSVWYSIAQLQDFINKIQSCRTSMPSACLGIRFYFAAYPDNIEWANDNIPGTSMFQELNSSSNIDGVSLNQKKQAGKLTLLLIPTCSQQNAPNSTYPTANPNDPDYNPIANDYISDIYLGSGNNSDSIIMAMNHGGSVPPPYYPGPGPGPGPGTDSISITAPNTPQPPTLKH